MFRKSNFLAITLLLGGLVLFLGSCRDIIEKDISSDTPELILPAVNDTLATNPLHVKWTALEGATKYRIEIVSPSFTNIQEYALDSIVTGTNFFMDLDSNVYQIRLTALNAGYTSQTTSPRTFWVGTSAGSSNGTIVLDAPASGAYVNESFNGNFSWFALSGTSSYTFELHQGANFSGTTLDYADQLGTTNLYSFTGADLDEGTYCWGVKAYYANGDETVYTKRILYLDTVNPTNAVLLSPANNANVSAGLVGFSWQLPSDLGTVQSPLIGTLQISTNATFTSLLTPMDVTGSSANYNLANGTYYWRIRMKDEAGNLGPVPTSYRTLNVF